MLIPIVMLFLGLSIGLLVAGLKTRSVLLLSILDILWFTGSLGTAWLVWLAWDSRAYSENWAMIGFIFCSLPYCLLTGIMLCIQLVAVRKWDGKTGFMLRIASTALLLFVVLQLVIGFASG